MKKLPDRSINSPNEDFILNSVQTSEVNEILGGLLLISGGLLMIAVYLLISYMLNLINIEQWEILKIYPRFNQFVKGLSMSRRATNIVALLVLLRGTAYMFYALSGGGLE